MIKIENEQKDKALDDSMENQAKKLNLNLNKFSRISISNTLNKYISKEDLNEFPKR